MFAVVANGFQGVCKTQRHLDMVLALYTYPKFRKVNTEEEAFKWIRENSRSFHSNRCVQYGNTASTGFLNVRYKIVDNRIEYNVDTNQVGFVNTINSNKDVIIRSGPNNFDVIIENVVLQDEKITSHIIAIKRILSVIGDYVDVNVMVPDMSVYLAITKYRGSNYIIQSLQRDIDNRLGGISFTVGG